MPWAALRAAWFGWYPVWRITVLIRSWVAWPIRYFSALPFKTSETVVGDTPALLAISKMVIPLLMLKLCSIG